MGGRAASCASSTASGASTHRPGHGHHAVPLADLPRKVDDHAIAPIGKKTAGRAGGVQSGRQGQPQIDKLFLDKRHAAPQVK